MNKLSRMIEQSKLEEDLSFNETNQNPEGQSIKPYTKLAAIPIKNTSNWVFGLYRDKQDS